ncbi:hypothetical protein V1520DRAFT_328382 [Lipomyces starkeyi]|uniref:Uncharacterized protein n=1 Tax=Lipomyces starkeyi NRRL Y-11557 TaxID=675824 RepID=A0A1E3PWU9_LIPST|nr:hypothetical protein LIPSTDRAFT_30419 [Lipomyces starkeyi NRRL Y-11557]
MATNGLELFVMLFETHRETDAGIVKSEPVYLVMDGADVSEEIPRDLSAIKVDDFVPYNWLSDDVVRRLAVNFLQPQRFMEVLSNAIVIVRTALSRVEDTFEVQEY